MPLTRFILLLFIGIAILTSCNSQPVNGSKPGKDTPAHEKLESFRQSFWDSLPKPKGWTNDYEGLFSEVEKQKLDSVIGAFQKETTTQICVVTLDSQYTSKEKFNDLALHIANTWGIGQKGKDNGVLICISKGHRKMRICNGYGIEKIVSDKETEEIMNRYFISNFKEGKYFQGTFQGLLEMVAMIRQKLNSK